MSSITSEITSCRARRNRASALTFISFFFLAFSKRSTVTAAAYAAPHTEDDSSCDSSGWFLDRTEPLVSSDLGSELPLQITNKSLDQHREDQSLSACLSGTSRSRCLRSLRRALLSRPSTALSDRPVSPGDLTHALLIEIESLEQPSVALPEASQTRRTAPRCRCSSQVPNFVLEIRHGADPFSAVQWLISRLRATFLATPTGPGDPFFCQSDKARMKVSWPLSSASSR